MPWYHFQASHGPGHQSSDERYQYFDKSLTKAEEKMWFEEYFADLDWPTGGVEMVESIPEHILASKIASCKNSIKYNRDLLKVLAKTESKSVIAVRLEVKAVPNGRPETFYSARLLMKPEVNATGNTRELAVKNLFKILKKWWRPTPRSLKEFAVILR